MTAPATRSAFTITVKDAIAQGFRAQLEQKVSALLTEAAQYRGQKLEPADAVTMAAFYLRDLSTDFPLLTTTDIQPIVWNGVKKVFGDYYGINAGTLHDWTAAWVASPDGQDALKERQKAAALKALPERRTRTAEEEDRAIRKAINDAYTRWLTGWRPEYPEGSMGDFLRRAGFTSVLDPLYDMGGYKRDYLHDHGFRGSLLDIYTAAKAAGKSQLLPL